MKISLFLTAYAAQTGEVAHFEYALCFEYITLCWIIVLLASFYPPTGHKS